jgi:mRNA-degrading endonuclease RelE of RelBE toxin-antitoxin system
MVKSINYKIVWDRGALDHFKSILENLEKQSKQAPKILKSAIIKRLDSIKSNPFICEIDKLKTPKSENFRAYTVYNYRITFQIEKESKEIRIVRIRHTSREPMNY